MLRILGTIVAAGLVTSTAAHDARTARHSSSKQPPPIDVAALLAAAHGASPSICSLASQSLRGNNWGSVDAPVTPLGVTSDRESSRRVTDLTSADIARLLSGLGSDDACVRGLSIRLIGDQSDTVVAPQLVMRLASSDASLRTVAALGLGLVRAEMAVDQLIGALRDATPGVRANAAWALGRMDAQAATGALAAAVTGDADARVREMSAWALGNADDSEAARVTNALATALRSDADPDVRETAAWALGKSGNESVTDALALAAGSDLSTKVRGTAAWALGHIDHGDARAVAALTHLLNDDDTDTRLRAAWALGQIGDASAAQSVRDALNRETNTDVRRALIRAYVKSGGDSAQLMSSLLDSKDPETQEAAVRSLAGGRAFNPWPWPWPRPRPWPSE
ncbi:MAG: HEAT repeat domain-containing protein [Gemmatimonadaceae bacterium]